MSELFVGLIVLLAILFGLMFVAVLWPDPPDLDPEPEAPRLRLLRHDPRPYDWARSCEYLNET